MFFIGESLATESLTPCFLESSRKNLYFLIFFQLSIPLHELPDKKGAPYRVGPVRGCNKGESITNDVCRNIACYRL